MYYNFNDKCVDGQSIIHLINLLPQESVVGAEIGVFAAKTFCTFLQQCNNISKLYGVDSYKPYSDYLKIQYDGTPAYSVDEKQIEAIKQAAYHNIKWSGYQEKAEFLEMDSSEAALQITDNELDFVFVDTYMTEDQVFNDLNDWYSKVRPGGIFSGHDWNCDSVQNAVNRFRHNNNIETRMSCFDATWVWIKP